MGFSIDGVMSEEENLFDTKFSHWDMVTGQTGSYLRTYAMTHNLTDWAGVPDLDETFIMRAWYYDNAVPVGEDEDTGAPEHPLLPN